MYYKDSSSKRCKSAKNDKFAGNSKREKKILKNRQKNEKQRMQVNWNNKDLYLNFFSTKQNSYYIPENSLETPSLKKLHLHYSFPAL